MVYKKLDPIADANAYYADLEKYEREQYLRELELVDKINENLEIMIEDFVADLDEDERSVYNSRFRVSVKIDTQNYYD